MEAGDELAVGEGLGDVIVAARAEARYPVGRGVERGQEEDGRVHASGPQGLTEIAAVGVLEPDVDDEQVGRALGLAAQRRLGAVAGRDVESLLGEAAENQVPEFRVVLDDLHVRCHHSPSIACFRVVLSVARVLLDGDVTGT